MNLSKHKVVVVIEVAVFFIFALLTPVLAQEATSTDVTATSTEITEESVIVDAEPTTEETLGSEDETATSNESEAGAQAEGSTSDPEVVPAEEGVVTESQPDTSASEITAPADGLPELVQPIESGNSDHEITASGIMIKYFVECDQLYSASSALCHDDLGTKYEMPISSDESINIDEGGKLYKQILMTIEYARQNAIKKMTDLGKTESDIPLSLFQDPTKPVISTSTPVTITPLSVEPSPTTSPEVLGASTSTDASAPATASPDSTGDAPVSGSDSAQSEPAKLEDDDTSTDASTGTDPSSSNPADTPAPTSESTQSDATTASNSTSSTEESTQ